MQSSNNSQLIKVVANKEILFHCKFEVASHVSKKNSRPIHRDRNTGRPRVGKSVNLRMAEQMYMYKFRQEKVKRGLELITGHVWAMMLFHFPKEVFFTKKGTVNKTLPDLSNLYELPQDCLTQAGVIFDDGLIFSHDYSRRLPSDNYYFELFLMPYDLTLDLHRRSILP